MPIVTISRGAFSGGDQLAEKLRERLQYKVARREVIIEAAKRYGVDEDQLRSDLHTPAPLWRRITHQQRRFVLAVQATLAEIVAEGDVIYHGLAGQFLLRGLDHVLKVRLNAPLEHRIRFATTERGVGRAEAGRMIETDDDQRARWVRQLYDAEWADPSLYDLVINLEQVGLDTAADLIASLARSAEYQDTPETRQQRKDFALATHVQAALILQSSFALDHVDVVAQKGLVELSGGKAFEKDRRAIVEYVRGLKGVRGVLPDDAGDPAEATPKERDEKKASDLMLPIKAYPHIRETTSIKEALLAIGASVVVLEDGHMITPRYVLVFDDAERVLGVVGRRDLLRGLSPESRTYEESVKQLGSMAALAKMAPPMTASWRSLCGPAALANASRPVTDIMTPIRGTVERHDPMSLVLTTMLRHKIDLVPVTEAGKTIGVVLMTDIFDIVADYILQGGRSA